MRFNDRALQIARFVKSDAALYSYYMLYYEQARAHANIKKVWPRDTVESYCHFLVWFILTGRREYAYPLAIPQEIREAIAYPNADGRHFLMDIVLATAIGLISDREEALAQYYFQALPSFGLGPFISRSELSALRGGARLKHLANLADRSQGHKSLPSTQRDHLLHQIHDLMEACSAPTLPSISIVGFPRSVLGLAEDARSLFDCLMDAGGKPEIIDLSPPTLERFEASWAYDAFEASRPNGSIVIFCMPIFDMMRCICSLGLVPAHGQYWIGYWPWETTTLHHSWENSFAFVDEVWASSHFLHEVYCKRTKKPVGYMPLCVQIPQPKAPHAGGIAQLFGSKFTFVCIFDFNSRIQRKNPIGTIMAFRAAFPKQTEPVQLVLKTLHADMRPNDFQKVRAAIGEDERIILIDGPFNREEICWIVQKSHVYLSLHRSEGFGRPIAEAMLLGTPVIATGWSGSNDFLNEETGYPVRYRLRPVSPAEYPFAAGEWADPDLDHAAAIMRTIYDRGGASRAITRKAQQLISSQFSRSNVSAKLTERLVAIGSGMTSRSGGTIPRVDYLSRKSSFKLAPTNQQRPERTRAIS